MKIRTNYETSSMSWKDALLLIKVIILCIFLLFAGKICMAQNTVPLTESEFANAYRNETVIPVRDKSAKIKSLIAIYSNGKAHLSWVVKNQVKQGTYIIERSFDGEYFEIVGLEKGTPSKAKREVIFQYMSPSAEKHSYYRIKHIANDNTVLVSEKTRAVSINGGSENSYPAERSAID